MAEATGAVQPAPQGDSAKDFSKRLGDTIIQIRDRRKPLEQYWLWNHACWWGRRLEERQFYHSDWKHYPVVGRRAIERVVTRATQLLLPSPAFFEVFPGDEFSDPKGAQADAVRAHLYYLLTKRINTRRAVTQWLRSFLLYQRAISKTSIAVLDAPVQWGNFNERVQQVWPTTRAVDAFSFYIWPETVTDVENASLVFEDIMMSWDDYTRAVQDKMALTIDRNDLGAPEWPYHHTIRLQHAGFTEPTATKDAQANETSSREAPKPQPRLFVSLTEAWFKVQGNWMQCWLVWNVPEAPRLVRLHRTPYPLPPYREALARPLPGEHYTTGLMDDVEPLQTLFNDQVNQTEESRSISALPPVAYSEEVFPRQDLLKWAPRALWRGGNVQDMARAIQAIQLPDTSASGSRAAQLTLALINSIGGAGGFAEGQPARGLPRAGFAVTSLISLATADIKDVAEVVEQEILTPLLADLHRLTVAFVPPTQIMRIPGTAAYPARALRLDDLVGNWSFQWVGSQQSQDQQVRAQRLMAGLQMLAKIEPALQQHGYTINWPALVKMVWRDGMGERGVEQIVVPMPIPNAGLMTQGAETQPGAGGAADMEAMVRQMLEQGGGLV